MHRKVSSASPAATLTRRWFAFVDRVHDAGFGDNGVLFAFALAVGLATGFAVVGFYALIDLAFAVFTRWPGTVLAAPLLPAYRPVLTGVGMLVAWWVMRRVGQGHDGMNVPDLQLMVARREDLPVRPAAARTVASALTLGSGGSAGSEGPAAVLGAAIGSALGRLFRFARARRVTLVGAGAAAGISAAFNAPLAGAFFALEEILGSFASTAFSAVVLSSVVAAIVSRAFFGDHPAFPVPVDYGASSAREVIFLYPLLGLVAGLVSAGFVRTYFRIDALVRALPLPGWGVALLGGACVGLLGYFSHGQLLGEGHFALPDGIFGKMALASLVLLLAGKVLATSLTLTAGGSGGVFAPALFVGAATGGAFGRLVGELFPALPSHPEGYGLVAMGAVVAGVTGAPITGILIVFEMTHDYAIMLPLMLTTVLCVAVARRLSPETLYSGWVRRRRSADGAAGEGGTVAVPHDDHARPARGKGPA